MSYDERKKIRKKKAIFQKMFVGIFCIYAIFVGFKSLISSNPKTVLPEKGTLIEKIGTKGFVIKDEDVVKSNSTGQLISYEDKEGQRISAGEEVATVNSSNNTNVLKEQIAELEKSITSLEKSEKDSKVIKKEKSKLEGIQANLVENLQTLISQGDFEDIYLIKSQLALYDEKNKDISFSNTLAGQSLENLKQKKDSLTSELTTNTKNYTTLTGGILSYNIDGYESVYLPKEFENYKYENLIHEKEKKYTKTTEINSGDGIFKVVDSLEWYVALKIEDNSQIEGLEKGNTVRISINGDTNYLKGYIVTINPSKDKSVIVIKLNTRLHEFYNMRFPKIDLILNEKAGLTVPLQSLIEKDAVEGVYIRDKSGIVRYRPVKVLGKDSNYAYVDIGDANGNIKLDGSDKLVRTITLYNEIILKPSIVKEGQILN